MKQGLRRLQRIAAGRFDVAILRHSESNYLGPHLQRVLAALQPDVILDVGANRGQFVNELRSLGFAGPVVSFEPTPSVFEQLVASRRDDPRWTGHAYALGATEGELTLHVYGGQGALNSLLEANDFGRDQFAPMASPQESIKVPVKTLDGIWASVVPDGRAFLKIDTQGFDLEVLRGAAGSMDRIVGVLTEVPVNPIYEGMPTMSTVFAHLEDLGFEMTGLFPVVRDRSRLRMVEANCVFVHRSVFT